MPDYKEMYAVLFRKITAVIDVLQDVQRQTEEMYIASNPPDVRVMPTDGKVDEIKDGKNKNGGRDSQ